jgi:hypothetical protein
MDGEIEFEKIGMKINDRGNSGGWRRQENGGGK